MALLVAFGLNDAVIVPADKGVVMRANQIPRVVPSEAVPAVRLVLLNRVYIFPTESDRVSLNEATPLVPELSAETHTNAQSPTSIETEVAVKLEVELVPLATEILLKVKAIFNNAN
jgi:hypothetical protein